MNTKNTPNANPDAEPRTPPSRAEFAALARARLEAADVHLLTLESDPRNEDAIRAVAQAMCLLRRYAAPLRLTDVTVCTEEIEKLLDGAGRGDVWLEGPAIDAAFDAVDFLKRAIGRAAELPCDSALPGLIEQLRAAAEGKSKPAAAVPAVPEDAAKKRLGELLIETGVTTQDAIETALCEQQTAPKKKMVGDILVQEARISPEMLRCALEVQKQAPGNKVGDILVAMRAVAEDEVESALAKQQAPEKPKLGEALVRSGQVSAKAVAQTLRSQGIWKNLVRFGLSPFAQPEPAPESTPEASAGQSLRGGLDETREFTDRAREHLKSADVHLLTLESDPKNEEAIGAVWRAFHSIQWVSAYLGLEDVAAYAREAENLLDKVRQGDLDLEGAVIDAAFDAVDTLKRLVGAVTEALETDAPLKREANLAEQIADLKSVAAGTKRAPMIAHAAPNKKLGEMLIESGVTTSEGIETALREQQAPAAKKMVGDILVDQVKVSRAQLDHALQIQRQNPERRLGDILVEMGVADPVDIEAALKKQQTLEKPKLGEALVRSGQAPAKAVAQTIRSQGILKNLARFGWAAIGRETEETEAATPSVAPPAQYLQGDPAKIRDFIARSNDHLGAADLHLLNLESNPKDRKALDAAVRGFYTIKWLSEYLGLDDITSVAREGEKLIEKARMGKLVIAGPALDAAFDAVEILRGLVGHVSEALETGGPLQREENTPRIVDYLKAAASGKKIIGFRPVAAQAAEGKKLGEILIESGITTAEELAAALKEQHALSARRMVGDILVDQIKLSRTQLERALRIQKREPSRRLGDILVEMGAVNPEDIAAALEEQRSHQNPKLGELLVRTGRASAKAVAHAIRTQGIAKNLIRLGLTAAAASAVLSAMPSAHAATDVTAAGGAAVVSVLGDGGLDTDGDGLPDSVEASLGTSPTDADSDQDGIPDRWEVTHALNPLDAADAVDDTDHDGAINLDEFHAGSQPFMPDSDGDGWYDGIEMDRGTDPSSADSAPVPSVPADVNADGKVNATDVQLVTNAALGLESPVPTDINQVGGTNAMDVQSVINAAVGR